MSPVRSGVIPGGPSDLHGENDAAHTHIVFTMNVLGKGALSRDSSWSQTFREEGL